MDEGILELLNPPVYEVRLAERRSYVVHGARPRVKRATPAHVTLKLATGRPSLRRKDVFRTLRHAVGVARRKGLQVVQFSILSNHIHLLLEPDDTLRMAREIQSLAISFARRLNKLTQAKGSPFKERHRLRLLRSPTEVRNALAYVLSNEAKHEGLARGTYFISQFSSGHAFQAWKALFGPNSSYRIATHWTLAEIERWLGEILVPAETWLLQSGWRRGRIRATGSRRGTRAIRQGQNSYRE